MTHYFPRLRCTLGNKEDVMEMKQEVIMKTFIGALFLSILLPLLAFAASGSSLSSEKTSEKFFNISPGDGVSASLGAPSKLTMDVGPSLFYLDWKLSPQDPGAVTGYEIMRATDYRGPYQKIAAVSKGISHYEDLTVKPTVVYFYKVRAVAGEKYSPFSNVSVGDLPPY